MSGITAIYLFLWLFQQLSFCILRFIFLFLWALSALFTRSPHKARGWRCPLDHFKAQWETAKDNPEAREYLLKLLVRTWARDGRVASLCLWPDFHIMAGLDAKSPRRRKLTWWKGSVKAQTWSYFNGYLICFEKAVSRKLSKE